MKSLYVLALSCAFFLAGAGCTPDRTDTTSAEYNAEQMEERTEAAFNDFKRNMEQRMEALEDRAEELKEEAKEAKADAKVEIDQQLAKLDAEMGANPVSERSAGADGKDQWAVAAPPGLGAAPGRT